jgi:hypothetical protein
MQRLRQQGHNEVFAAVLVAPAFEQDASGLSGVSKQFLAETGVSVAFLQATLLGQMVTSSGVRSPQNAIFGADEDAISTNEREPHRLIM